MYIIIHEYIVKNIITINRTEKLFPALLGEIPGAPKKLFVLGEPEALSLKSIAIVGTRKASAAGLQTAKAFAYELARAGLTIISGLAMGIDTAAHQGALKAGGKTVAVLGRGVNKIYPAQNISLAREIVESGGAVVSEYDHDMPTLPHNFLERNRITSGLALATIVIEAPQKSGALSTAGHAAMQGRDVFVVPGPINQYHYRGSHELIRDGAILVTSPIEILNELGIEAHTEPLLQSDNNQPIIKALEFAGRPLPIDKLIENTGLSPAKTASELGILVMEGHVLETPQGYTLI